MYRTFFFVSIITVLVLAIFGFLYFKESRHVSAINSFEECEENGYPVMESYPRQCMTPDGRSFTENISNTDGNDEENLNDDIHVNLPQPNAKITSPLVVKGEARGTWFFEASFPVRLVLENGDELVTTPAEAQGEWMTEDFVPFEATLTFAQPIPQKGTLILMKDNPSGLPEFDKSISIPVVFEASQATIAPCVVTGCSGQICSDKQVASTCEFREEYMCYKSASCERQANGKCGWTETAALSQCLSGSINISS